MFDTLPLAQGARRQRGFTLIELSLVLVLMSMAITTFISLQAQQASDNQARAVAQTYARMNKAVGGYLQTYYKNLTALPAECSRVGWAANNGSGLTTPTYTGCQLDLQINNGPVTAVANALQPTPKELAQLGFLEGGSNYEDRLPLPTLSAANPNLALTTGNWLVGGSGGTLPGRFMVLVQFMCINGGIVNGETVSQFTTTGACGSGTIDLRSLVFNSQPYNVQATDPSSKVLYQALDIVGSDGYLSGPGPGTDTPNQDTGELRSVRAAAEPTLSNPTRLVSGNAGAGAPFILAMRSGYGTADWSLFKKQLEDLQAKMTTLENNQINQGTSILGLNSTVAGLRTDLDSTNTTVGGLRTDLNSTNTTVGGLRTDLTTLGGTVTNLDGRVTNLNTSVGNLNSTVSGLSGSVTNLNNNVSNLNNTVTNIQTYGATRWAEFWSDDDTWYVSEYPCAEWSQPTLAQVSGDRSGTGFSTNVGCNGNTGTWAVYFVNWASGRHRASWTTIRGYRGSP
jgi:prepilin-type N-terminal cleavage/methylation domain-containing protein